MNSNILFVLFIAIFLSVMIAVVVKDFRHAFLVTEGYAGLLYHKGKFVELLGAGRHIRWGRLINVQALEVKDVMFPPDLKRAFGEVLKAKQEGQAALERARGESASLRNLANAA